ncbi:MAG: HEAT repeat domain-containing protein [Terriglobia bacterium]
MKKRSVRWFAGILCLWAGLCLLPAASGFPQEPQVKPPKEPSPSPAPGVAGEEQPPAGDWAPSLLYGILSSPNAEAPAGLLRATFAAGPAIIPQLAAALQDDRTAEYAAQALAYIGGDQTLPILWKLLSDSRDLNLRRFTYSALAEFDSPQATDMLFDVINKSDSEPDRTVTESAVIALTVRTDTTLLTRIQASEKLLQDVVIRDDLDNARVVIAERAKYLATPEGKKSGGSIESAVRTYFLPALEPPPAPEARAATPVNKSVGKAPSAAAASSLKPPRPLITVDVRSVTFSPDKNRALAQVVFADPAAMAYYDFILQKRFGNWTLASVWMGPEVEKKAVGSGQWAVGSGQ